MAPIASLGTTAPEAVVWDATELNPTNAPPLIRLRAVANWPTRASMSPGPKLLLSGNRTIFRKSACWIEARCIVEEGCFDDKCWGSEPPLDHAGLTRCATSDFVKGCYVERVRDQRDDWSLARKSNRRLARNNTGAGSRGTIMAVRRFRFDRKLSCGIRGDAANALNRQRHARSRRTSEQIDDPACQRAQFERRRYVRIGAHEARQSAARRYARRRWSLPARCREKRGRKRPESKSQFHA